MAAGEAPLTTRAWQYSSTKGGIEVNLRLNSEATVSVPKPDQHLVRIIAVALNPVDYKPAEVSLVMQFAIPKPATPGIDFVGRIIAPAAGSGLQPGQLVFGEASSAVFAAGALKEVAITDAKSTVAVPDGVAPVDAAALPVAAGTARNAIAPYVKPGDRVFINGGSGGVGVFAIQIAKILGCHATTTCSATNIELCKSLGADDVIDYRNSNVLEELKKHSSPYDHVIDNAGADSTLYWRGHEYMGPKARFVVVGASPTLVGFKDMLLMHVLPGFLGGGRRKITHHFNANKQEDLQQLVGWIKEGKIKAIVDSRFPFEQVPKAFEKLKTGRAKGKIIVEVDLKA